VVWEERKRRERKCGFAKDKLTLGTLGGFSILLRLFWYFWLEWGVNSKINFELASEEEEEEYGWGLIPKLKVGLVTFL